MNDRELIELVATIWVKNGGDREGFEWLQTKIAQKISEFQMENNTDENHSPERRR